MSKTTRQTTTTNVRQRKNGLWEGRYRHDGKQKSVYGKTRKEVRDKLSKIQSELAEETYVDETNMTVEQWLKEFMDVYINDVKGATIVSYETMARLHINPTLGSIRLKELTAAQVQRFYKKLSNDGFAPKTIRGIHGFLHEALQKAVNMEVLRRNVTEACQLPKVRGNEMHPLNNAQLQDFLKRAEDDPFFHPLFYVAFFTGLRECELIGLTWDCVDFERGTLRVYRQYGKLDSGPHKGEYDFSTLKNDKERTFRVAPSVLNIFRQMKVRQAEQKLKAGSSFRNKRNFIFTRDDGEPVSASTLYHHYKKIVLAMDLPEVRFHDARHTFATLSLQSGVDIKTVSEALGHASVAFTLSVYGHVTELMQQDMANKMERLIGSL